MRKFVVCLDIHHRPKLIYLINIAIQLCNGMFSNIRNTSLLQRICAKIKITIQGIKSQNYKNASNRKKTPIASTGFHYKNQNFTLPEIYNKTRCFEDFCVLHIHIKIQHYRLIVKLIRRGLKHIY